MCYLKISKSLDVIRNSSKGHTNVDKFQVHGTISITFTYKFSSRMTASGWWWWNFNVTLGNLFGCTYAGERGSCTKCILAVYAV